MMTSSDIKRHDRNITRAYNVSCPTCLARPHRVCIFALEAMGVGNPHEARMLAGAAWVPPEGAAVVYLDTVRGDDATGERGNPERPFVTPNAAIGAMRDGDTLYPAMGTLRASAR